MVQLVAPAAESAEANKGIAVITGHGEVLPDDYVVTFYPEDNKKRNVLFPTLSPMVDSGLKSPWVRVSL